MERISPPCPRKWSPSISAPHQFAALHPEAGYSQSLEQLGSRGNGCLPDDLLKSDKFSIVYRPGESDSHGRVTSYTFKAEELPPHGADYSSIFTDESGLVLVSERGPHGGMIPRLFSRVGLDISAVLTNCLYLESEVFQVRADPEATERAFQKCAQRHLSDYALVDGTLNSPWSKITYRFNRNASGTIDGFAAEVRPIKYGDRIGGIRSYLIDERFSEHAIGLRAYGTPEDRPANTSDPLTDECETQDSNARSAENAEGHLEIK